MYKKKILFVCSMNTCRSPLAEAVLESVAGDRYEACSAGIFASAGAPVAEYAKLLLSNGGYGTETLAGKRAAPLTEKLMSECDVAVGMTKEHAHEMRLLFPEYAAKVTCMPYDIRDPFEGVSVNPSECLCELVKAVNLLIERDAS